ncbi:MAG TPA: DUF1080 domain-containing protein [Opitutaceae bacterium]
MNPAIAAVCTLGVVLSVPASDSEWRPLFDVSLNGWRTWLGTPNQAVEVPGAPRDAQTGAYLGPVGWDKDPLRVFSITEVDGRPALHISGNGFGEIRTVEAFSNYHLRLQFKWGERKYPPRESAVRDSGLLYHVNGEPGRSSRFWPACVELQIQEHDTGDLYSIISKITVPAVEEQDSSGRTTWRYDPAGRTIEFKQERPIGNRCVKGADFERPIGEWNTVELVVLGDRSVHIVNGHVVMRLHAALQQPAGSEEWQQLTSGHISLQTEGAEIFYRDIEIRPITAIPAAFAE